MSRVRAGESDIFPFLRRNTLINGISFMLSRKVRPAKINRILDDPRVETVEIDTARSRKAFDR